MVFMVMPFSMCLEQVDKMYQDCLPLVLELYFWIDLVQVKRE